MARITGADPVMWGDAIVGLGQYHDRYASGREGDWFLTGFSPRKRNLTIYLMDGFDAYGELLTALGPHRLGESCRYLRRLDEIDLGALEELLARSVRTSGLTVRSRRRCRGSQ